MDGNPVDKPEESFSNKDQLLKDQVQYLNDELYKVKKEYEEEKKKHEEDLEASRSDVKHILDESINLKLKISQLQEDLDDVESQFVTMVGDKTLRNENLLLRKDIRSLKTQCEDLADKYEMARDEYNSAIFESNDLRKQLAAQKSDLLLKSNEIKRAWRELEQNRSDMAMMMREYAEAKKENSAAPSNWKELDDENRRLKNDVETITRHNESISTLLNELRMELARINEQRSALPSLPDENSDDLQTNGESLETKGLVSSVLTPQDVNSALGLAINSLTVMISEFGQSDFSELIRRISSLTLVKKQLILVNDEASVLVHKQVQHQQVLIDQDKKIEDLTQQLQKKEEEMAQLTESSASRNEQLEKQQAELTAKSEEVTRLQNEIASLSTSLSKEQSTSDDSNQQVAVLSEQLQRINEERDKIVQEKKELEDQISTLTRGQNDLKRKVTELQKREESAVSLLDSKDLAIQQFQLRVEELTVQTTKLQEENRQASSANTVQMSELKSEVADKDRKIAELEDDLDDAEEALDNEKEATKKLRNDLKEVTDSRNQLRLDVKDLEEDNDELMKEIQEMKEERVNAEEKEKEYQAILSQNHALQNEIADLKKQMEQMKSVSSPAAASIPQCVIKQGRKLVFTNHDDALEFAQEAAVDPEGCSDVVELCLANCELDNDDVAILATVFEMGGLSDLRVLDVSHNSISLRGCTTLLHALVKRDDNSNGSKNLLQKLLFANNRIKEKGYRFLLQQIAEKKFAQLWELDVSHNELDASCVQETSKLLSTHPEVAQLHDVRFAEDSINGGMLQEFDKVLRSSYK